MANWVKKPQRLIWDWAGHLIRRKVNEAKRWGVLALDWKPDGCRCRGCPCKRWSDDIESHMTEPVGGGGGASDNAAQDRHLWAQLGESFSN